VEGGGGGAETEMNTGGIEILIDTVDTCKCRWKVGGGRDSVFIRGLHSESEMRP
jgi:hypothetical protein